MGMFGSRKKLYVSSSVYNMAGPVKDRPNVMKSTIASSVVRGDPSVADAIKKSLLQGPAARFRRYNNWASRSAYAQELGMASGAIYAGDAVDKTVLAQYLPVSPGTVVDIEAAYIDAADYTYWALKYLAEHSPQTLLSDYVADYSESTQQITITHADGSIEVIPSDGFIASARYLYARYSESGGAETFPEIVGDVVILPSGSAFPDTTGWENQGVQSNDVTYTLTTTTTVTKTPIGGGTPTTTTGTSSEDSVVTESTQTYKKITSLTFHNGVGGVFLLTEFRYDFSGHKVEQQTTTTTVTDAVETTVTTTVTDVLVEQDSYHQTEQVKAQATWSPVRYFLYREASGNTALDAMFSPSTASGSFFPIIPFRVNNKFVSELNVPDILKISKKAYKKAVDGDYDDMVESLKENKSLGDIDYAYTIFGVSLNTKNSSSARYLYEFFASLINAPEAEQAKYAQFRAEWDAAELSWNNWAKWRQDSSLWEYDEEGAVIEPRVQSYPTYSPQTLNIKASRNLGNPTYALNYNISLQWDFIVESSGAGMVAPGLRKVGEVWVELGDPDIIKETGYTTGDDGFDYVYTNEYALDRIYIYWQVSSTRWKRIAISNLTHNNNVYGGKSVFITAKQALLDDDESGFIIPIHEAVFKQVPVKHRNQMSTDCCFMMFNCYVQKKLKWYQTGIFVAVMVILAVVITIATMGGTSASIGVALGLGGTAATVAGAIVIVGISMLASTIINKIAVKVFGEKYGPAIGSIIMVLASAGASLGASGSAITVTSLCNAVSLTALTIAAGNGYAAYTNARMREVSQQTADLIERTNKELKAIQKKYQEEFGANTDIDISQALMDSTNGSFNESVESFLGRTLMCGSDIVELTHSLIENFAEVTISTEL